MNDAGADARLLLEHLAARYPGLLRGPRVEAPRQILVQNYHWDHAGRLLPVPGVSRTASPAITAPALPRLPHPRKPAGQRAEAGK